MKRFAIIGASILAVCLLILGSQSITASLVNKEKEPSTPILTKKDISLILQTIAFSRDTKTKSLLDKIVEKITVSGFITRQEIIELTELFGGHASTGFFILELCDYFTCFPGCYLLNYFNFYAGPILLGIWSDGYFLFHGPICSGIIIGGFGLAIQAKLFPESGFKTGIIGACVLYLYF
jgi:hypothetical protein